jgi:hypothetical protein
MTNCTTLEAVGLTFGYTTLPVVVSVYELL